MNPTIADFLLLLSILASLGLAVTVVRHKSNRIANIIFFFFILAMLGWTSANFVMDAAGIINPSLSLFSARMTAVTMSWAPLLLFLFVSSFALNQKEQRLINKKTTIIGSSVALCLTILSLTELIVAGVNTKTYPVEIIKGPLYMVLIFYIVVVSLLALVKLVSRYISAEGTEKKQLLYLLVGIGLMVVTALTTNVFLVQVFSNSNYVRLGAMSPLLLVAFVTYGISKHRLFNIKILSAQILMTALILITIAQMLTAEDLMELIFRIVVLLLITVIGISLIKSVVREHNSAEKIHNLNKKLTSSNAHLEQLTTDLQEANRHLKELMKIKTEFLQIASHQLRTPLTSLRGLLEMQAEGNFADLPDEEKRKMQTDMLGAANHLNNIVNDLLDAMELEGGNLNFSPEQVDVIEQLKEAVKTLQPAYDKKDLTVTINAPQEPLPKIEADKSYLQQVFLNIINNAEKYTENGGLTITPRLKEDKMEISFQDTGIGIEKEELSKLFGKFVRGKRSALVHTDGSGLGLFIIKKIVEEHGGSVTIESEGKDKGTTVRVTLPLRQANK